MNKILLILYVIIVYEICIMLIRKIKRRIVYQKAKKRARLTGKKLLVIGDPYNGIASKSTGIDYSCGDICIDLTGCPMCPESVKGRLEDTIGTLKMDDYIIYISCVLEYVDDLEYINKFLDKTSKEDLFVVNVEWYSFMAWFYPYFLTKERPPKYINGPFGYFKNPFF
jgi:hypothetical protein